MQSYKSALMLLLLAAMSAVDMFAQTGIASVVGQGTADRAIDAGGSGFEIQALSDSTTATVKASRTFSRFGLFNETQLSASAPLSKGSDSTSIAAASGFPNAFTVTAKYVGFNLASKPFDANAPTAKAICDEIRAAALARGMTQKEADDLICESGNVFEYVPGRIDDFEALFFDMTMGHSMYGASGTVGHRTFEYLQTTDHEKATASRTPWGASIFAGFIPPNSAMLLAAGFEYRDKYKDADAATVCPPAGSAAVQCKTGAIGAPKQEQQKIVYAEVRRLFLNRAVSLKLAYDFETDKPSADLPIYLIRTAGGALSGGIRAGWEKDKDPQFGVFVSGTFSLFPF
jgi:hypothetical protein